MQLFALRLLRLGELEVERLALAPLPLERGIIAAVDSELAALDVQDGVDRLVEQVAVVADHDHGSRIARDVLFQPERAFEVEIVGRLVEQEEIGLGEQRGGERDPHAPAAGELGAGALLILMREAKAGEDLGGARGRRMRADVGEAGLDLGDAMRIGCRLGLGQERVALRIGLEHDLDQALGPVRRFLREPPDAGARRQCELAVIERDVARDGAKQRGLADAVASDQADPRAVRNARGGAFQSSLPATRSVMSSITSMRAIWPTGRRDATSGVAPGTSADHHLAAGCQWRRIIMCVPGCQEAVHQALSRRRFFKGAAAASFAAVAASRPG